MNSTKAPVPSSCEPTGARPVLPSGIEAGLVGGIAVAIIFFARDLFVGHPMQTPSMLGTLMLQGAEAARTVTSAPGAAIAYNAIHFAVWIFAGSIGIQLMRQVEAFVSQLVSPVGRSQRAHHRLCTRERARLGRRTAADASLVGDRDRRRSDGLVSRLAPPARDATRPADGRRVKRPEG